MIDLIRINERIKVLQMDTIRTIQFNVKVFSIQNSIGRKMAIAIPVQTVFQKFETIFEHLDEKTRIMVEECINEGWYPVAELDAGFYPQTENFEAEMVEAIEDVLPEIEYNLCEHNPNRATSISAGFDAHKRGEYTLSIPCLFPQANGICEDIIGINPFSNKAGIRLKNKMQDYGIGTYSELYFKPLFESDDIRGNTEIVSPEKLNRHAVMHGTSNKCYTKVNSLKLISFISSLDWFLDDFRQTKISNTE